MEITHVEPMLIALPYEHGAPKPALGSGAAMKQDAMCEYYFCDLGASPMGDAILARDGFMTVPDGPGLGVDMDMEVIERHRCA